MWKGCASICRCIVSKAASTPLSVLCAPTVQPLRPAARSSWLPGALTARRCGPGARQQRQPRPGLRLSTATPPRSRRRNVLSAPSRQQQPRSRWVVSV
jgi:hypothetical protein